VPAIAATVFLFANFLFVPALVLAAPAVAPRRGGARRALGPAETALLATVALVFLFNNLAPPYEGWQLRGVWIARLYQPIVGALFSAIAVVAARGAGLPGVRRAALRALLLAALAGNVWVTFGPALGAPALAGEVHYRFYRHAPRPLYAENLRRYGARPVGFCTPPPGSASSAESVRH
jgi:hypothetical protein